MAKKLKLKLEDLKVESFTTELDKFTAGAGLTGNCLSFINVTCPDPNCDFQSIPLDECDIQAPISYRPHVAQVNKGDAQVNMYC